MADTNRPEPTRQRRAWSPPRVTRLRAPDARDLYNLAGVDGIYTNS